MITLLILLLMTLVAGFIAISIIGIGGGLFLVIGADIIVAVSVIWFLFFRK